MDEFLRLVATERIDVTSLVSHTFALDDAERAYQTIMAPSSTSLAVLLKYPVASDAGRGGPAYAPRRKLAVAPPARSDGRLRVALVGAVLPQIARRCARGNIGFRRSRGDSIGRLRSCSTFNALTGFTRITCRIGPNGCW